MSPSLFFQAVSNIKAFHIISWTLVSITVAPRYNEPRYNEDPVIASNI